MGRSLSDLVVFIAKRMVQLALVLFGAVVVTFVVTHLSSSDPCLAWIGPHAGQAAYQNCQAFFDLNQPIYIQLLHYLQTLLSGSWGVDTLSQQPVLSIIGQTFPATFELIVTALVLMIVIGIPLGVIAANSNGRWADHLVRIFYLSGWAVPTYLGAVLLAVLVAPVFHIAPTGAFTGTPPFPQRTHLSVLDALLAGSLPWTVDALEHLALPAIALAFFNLGIATRMTRAAMLEVLPLEYVRTARMKGLTEVWVLYKHALRNALITTVTVLGLTAGYLLSGTVVIEAIFTWPGIGFYAYNSIEQYDITGVVGTVIVFSIGVVVANLAADILYGVLDPRVEWR
ncbi:MAG: ABC transporter permease [Thermoplasmata archaeon]|nr:ABC transporter permease [Thermoplasmata archaeon]